MRRREGGHVDPEFRDDDCRADPIDAGDLRQPRVLRGVRDELLVDAFVDLLDGVLDLIEPFELHREQEAVVLFDATFERSRQHRNLPAQAATRKLRHLLRCGRPFEQRSEHAPSPTPRHLPG